MFGSNSLDLIWIKQMEKLKVVIDHLFFTINGTNFTIHAILLITNLFKFYFYFVQFGAVLQICLVLFS